MLRQGLNPVFGPEVCDYPLHMVHVSFEAMQKLLATEKKLQLHFKIHTCITVNRYLCTFILQSLMVARYVYEIYVGLGIISN